MKKVLSILMAIVMVFTIAPITAFAKNGPSTESWVGEDGSKKYPAYVSLYSVDEKTGEYKSYELFSDNKAQKSKIKGASYSRKTNTLTLKNVKKPKLRLETNMMGDDFKLKIEGKCELGLISVFGWGYNSSLKITGTGTLTVNKNKEYPNAIKIIAENSKCNLTFDKKVKVKLYASKDVISSVFNKQTKAEKAVKFANGDKVTVKKAVTSVEYEKTVMCYYDSGFDDFTGYKTTSKSEKDKNVKYGVTEANWYDDNGKEINGYEVMRFVYSKDLNRYFLDINYGEYGSKTFTEAEFAKTDFKIAKDSDGYYVMNDFTSPSNRSTMTLAKDKNGKKYAIYSEYVYNEKTDESSEKKVVYTIKSIPELGDEYYYAKKTTKVKAKNLTSVKEKETYKGLYDYTVNGTQFAYNCAPIKPTVSKTTAKSKAFKVAWNKVTGATGYEIQYSTDSKFKKNTKTVKAKATAGSKTIKKLKGSKKYYVRVRVRTKTNGKTYTSSWSKAKSVKTKK